MRRTGILEIRNPRTQARVKSVLKKNFPFWFGQGLLTAPHLPQFIRITVDRHACVFKRQVFRLPHDRHPKQVEVVGQIMPVVQGQDNRPGSQVVLDPLGSGVHHAGKERKVFLNPLVPWRRLLFLHSRCERHRENEGEGEQAGSESHPRYKSLPFARFAILRSAMDRLSIQNPQSGCTNFTRPAPKALSASSIAWAISSGVST